MLKYKLGISIVLTTVCFGCNTGTAPTLEQMSTSNTSTLVVLPTATITATETLTPQFSSPTPSSTSIPSPESTATEDPVISKQMLIMVNEAITGLARDEVWILSPEENIPRPLLSDQRLSISSPRWSRNGERIAFAQYPKTSPEKTSNLA